MSASRPVSMADVRKELEAQLTRARIGKVTGSVELTLHLEDGKVQKAIHGQRGVNKVVDGE